MTLSVAQMNTGPDETPRMLLVNEGELRFEIDHTDAGVVITAHTDLSEVQVVAASQQMVCPHVTSAGDIALSTWQRAVGLRA